MKKIIKIIKLYLQLFGVDTDKIKAFFGSLPHYIRTYYRLKKQLKQNTDFNFSAFLPMMADRKEKSGSMTGHYFNQDLLVAQKIYEKKPLKHVDIGSRVDGFVSHLAVFRAVEVFDIRPLWSDVENIRFKQADLMQLDGRLKNYCDSLSSLHVIEHFGLGRYGDPIDANGHLKAIHNYSEILKKGGTMYISVPMGRQRIEFNAHRVFSVNYLISIFEDKFEIISFSYINDEGKLFKNADCRSKEAANNFNCKFGCAIFELIKL